MLVSIAPAAALSPSPLFKPNSNAAPGKAPPQSAANRQMQDALTALKVLNATSKHSSASDAAKANAKQKLESLKAQLKTLMLMGGSARQRASQAAAIAKEIAAAAKAYGEGGGDASNLTAPTPGAGPADVAAQAPDKGTSGGSTGAGVAAAVPSPGVQSPASSAGGQDPAASSIPTASAPTAITGRDLSQADKDFIQDVKDLAQQVKSIIKAAEHALKRHGGALDHDIAHTTDKALDEANAAVDAMSPPSTGGYDSAIAVPSLPAISIMA
jgi:hypothetical protein